MLDLVCNVALKSKPERAEIAIRCFKFILRGFTCTADCIDRIRSEFIPGFPALTRVAMVEYFRRQVLFKAAPQDWPIMLRQFQEVMEKCGCGDAYEAFIHPMQEDLLK